MPIFWTALIMMYVFAVKFKQWGLPYLPTVGKYDLSVGPTILQFAWHMILPVSSITGEGFDGFYEALKALVAAIEPKVMICETESRPYLRAT